MVKQFANSEPGNRAKVNSSFWYVLLHQIRLESFLSCNIEYNLVTNAEIFRIFLVFEFDKCLLDALFVKPEFGDSDP